MPVMFFIGYAFQSFLLNRILGEGSESPLLVTFGISIILQNSLLAVFNPDARSLTSNLATQSITITPYTGTQYLIIAFGVVVIGGMGSVAGTLVAGIILGLAQVLGAHFFGTGMQLLSGYIVLLAMLVLRPQGLFAHN